MTHEPPLSERREAKDHHGEENNTTRSAQLAIHPLPAYARSLSADNVRWDDGLGNSIIPMPQSMMPLIELLDIGGEGRYLDAWNLNPNETKTLGLGKATAIPRRIDGRAEAIPLADRSVGSIIMERTPLRRCAIAEMLRVVQRGGTIVLRHRVSDHHDPHVWAHRLIPVRADIRRIKLGNQQLQESKYDLGRLPKQITQRE